MLARLGLAALIAILPPVAGAEEPMTWRFEAGAEDSWRFFTDRVMGGVSEGRVTVLTEDGTRFARMTGEVSTANHGGFIQMRLDLAEGAAEGAQGVRLIVRGNSQRYFVHLRTQGTRLPWQYYQAGFDVGPDWAELRLPFEAFRPSGAMLALVPEAERLTSLGVVAYGRDHAARIDVAEVGFY
jgi:hypothetical protein